MKIIFDYRKIFNNRINLVIISINTILRFKYDVNTNTQTHTYLKIFVFYRLKLIN
jgi:hypothetical protein